MKDNHLCMGFIYSTTREKYRRYKLRQRLLILNSLGWDGGVYGVLSGAHAPGVV